MNQEKDKVQEEMVATSEPVGEPQNEGEEEKDKLDELLADVPEWLRGPLKQYYKQILVTISLIVVVACLISGYSYYIQRQEAAAAFQLGIAMASSNIEDKIAGFEKIQKSFSNTDAAKIAELLIGQVYLQTGKWDQALDAFKRAEGDFTGIMADTAVMGQAYSHEEKKALNEALSLFQKVAANENGMEIVATLDKARVLKELGRTEEAIKAFDRYLDLDPKSPLLDFIRFQVINLSDS